MLKGILSLILFVVIVFGNRFALSQTTSVSTGVSKDVTTSQDVDPTAMSTKVKAFFNKNEQKKKVMRSKDIVRYKQKIREQEMLRIQKEREIKYLERRLNEKQKTLDRLERTKGE